MATSFETLFSDFLDTEVNSTDLSKYTPPQLSRYLSKLLKRAREEIYNLIYNNPTYTINKMDDVIEFYNQEYNLSCNTITTTQVLNPIPNQNSIFYVTVNNTPTNNFSFNNVTNEITINNMSSQQNNINIIAYINGQFNQTLTLVEQGILVDWMAVTFQKDKIKEQRLYNISVYGEDYGEKSQANHLRALEDIYENDRKAITTKTLEYTFRNNQTNYKGFGGKGGLPYGGLV